MHWILLLVSVIGFAAAVFAPTPGMMGVGLVVGFVALFGGFLGLISARIAERARPEAMLFGDAEINALRKSVREAREKRAAERTDTAPPPGSST
jgi:Sec-independent protein secretion pathway component TatC